MNDQPEKTENESTEMIEVKCLNCGSSSENAVLLSCVREGENDYVCVKCLPMLIHGPH